MKVVMVKLSTPKRGRRAAAAFMAVATMLLSLLALSNNPADASAMHHVYRTCSTPGGCGMWLRDAPAPGANHLALMYDGDAFNVSCWSLGAATYGNPVWLQGTWNGRVGWAMDYYIDTHWNTTQDLTNQGMPQCGSGGSSGGSSGGGSTDLPAVWVGSPIDAAWSDSSGCSGAVFPSNTCSLPSVHHYSTPGTTDADFAVDIQPRPGQNIVGQPAYLYSAPGNASVSIQVKVDTISSPCLSGNPADGGYQVIVGFYTNNGATRIGSATYAHISPAVSAGQWINRWGTKLGTVGSYRPNRCWSGPHLHFQMYSVKHYACYNKGWHPSQYVYRSNFLGYTGGNFAGSARQACP